MRLHAAALALVLCSSPTWAQSVYKCGSTYSQTPCAHDAKTVNAEPAVPLNCSNYENSNTPYCKQKSEAAREKAYAKFLVEEDARKKAEVEKKEEQATERREKVQRWKAAQDKAASEIAAYGKRPIDKRKIDSNFALCNAALAARLKDPMSAQFSVRQRIDAVPISVNGNGDYTPGVPYQIQVNAKNSFGAYTGSQPYTCFFDLTESRILNIEEM